MRRTAFTLLEMLVVLALVGALAAAILPALGGWAGGGMAREALGDLRTILLTERIEAMKSGARRAVELVARDGRLVLVTPDREVDLGPRGPRLRWADGSFAAGARAEFDGSGRTAAREWRFGPAVGTDTLWVIHFDPVSGAAELRRWGETAPAGTKE